MVRARNCSFFFLLFALIHASAQQSGEWPSYGNDPGNTKYSPLTQINKSNVQKLKIAWTWKPGEQPVPEKGIAPGSLKAIPIMVDGVVYLSTSMNHVVALDANTGKQLWDYDPASYQWGKGPPGVRFGTHRGVAIWGDASHRRIFLPTRGRLIGLDAKTGKPIDDFGTDGEVDMTSTLVWPVKDRAHFNNTSPPVVYNDLVIVGSAISDSLVYEKSPPGDVQAFDARTGKRVWSFHTIPQKGEFGTETWEKDSWQNSGHANVWTPFTLDEKRGLVYLPISTPANDHYGGDRKGNNLFADTLVCLDAKTGKRLWHFQTVHHNLWDYDGTSTPVLLTIRVDGKTIDAVAAPAKTGFTYVFDRVTGKPVWPIEERPVPQSDVPGEKTSPTQPFPTKPPPHAKQGFTPDDVVDFTPEIHAMAMEKLKGYRFGPIFNPPSLQGSLMMPSNGGGTNWGGAAADPETGILYVKSKNNLRVIRLEEIKPEDPVDAEFSGVNQGAYRYNFPTNLTIADGLLLNKPPYGTVTAIDLNRGEILWQKAVGDMPQIRNNPLLKNIKLPPLGGIGNEGAAVTRGGLLFVGMGDRQLHALDKTSGEILWEGNLNAASNGSPITYQTRSGRQFVIIATGSGQNAELVAFALPTE